MSTTDKVILLGISLASLGLGLYSLTGVLNSFGRKEALIALLGAAGGAATGYMVNKALGKTRVLKAR